MKRLVMAAAGIMLALALNACAAVQTAQQPIGDQAVADARNTIFALKASYGATLRAATAYVRLPPCSLPTSPAICSSTAVVTQLAKAQLAASSAIDSAEEAILNAKGSSSVLATAVDAAKAAYASFRGVTDAYSTGGS